MSTFTELTAHRPSSAEAVATQKKRRGHGRVPAHASGARAFAPSWHPAQTHPAHAVVLRRTLADSFGTAALARHRHSGCGSRGHGARGSAVPWAGERQAPGFGARGAGGGVHHVAAWAGRGGRPRPAQGVAAAQRPRARRARVRGAIPAPLAKGHCRRLHQQPRAGLDHRGGKHNPERQAAAEPRGGPHHDHPVSRCGSQ